MVCVDDTDARWLNKSKKMVYMGHRMFLHRDHPYRRNKKFFDGSIDNRFPPKYCNGSEIYKIVSKVEVVFGKGKGSVHAPNGSIWKKNSLFWRLPYWKILHVRHALDGMHLTKNVAESTLDTLMDTKWKGKDSLEARQDLEEMGVRPELHPIIQPDGKKKLPVAAWTLGDKEKKKICKFFDELKVPTGYSSNIRRLVNRKETKFNMSCLKAHDCHVIMTQLLPAALRGVLPTKFHGTLALSHIRARTEVVLGPELSNRQSMTIFYNRSVTKCRLHMISCMKSFNKH